MKKVADLLGLSIRRRTAKNLQLILREKIEIYIRSRCVNPIKETEHQFRKAINSHGQ